MLDLDDNRLATAKELGATHTINSTNVEDLAQVKSLNHRGVDVAIEVGIPQTFDLCQKLIGVDGTIANVSVHGLPVQFDIDKLWIKNINVTTGLV